jgi:hypothetical protein
MAYALIAVHDNGLASEHCQDIAFRADVSAGSTTDAIIGVDLRVLGTRAFRVQFAFFNGDARLFFLFSHFSEMKKEKGEDDGGGQRK